METNSQEILFHGYTPFASGDQVYLERPRVMRLLEKAIQKPIVSVTAGAGYGKTCAVYTFVKKLNVRTAWIQCSGGDNNGEHFWGNYIQALSIISDAATAKLAEMGFPFTDDLFERYLALLKKNVMPNEKYIFVFDDIHLVSNTAVLRFLERCVSAASPNVSSVFISRTEPAINMPGFESKKLLGRITEAELVFSQDEMFSYFKLHKISPSRRLASAVYQSTEGWAFAIQLACLAIVNDPAGTGRHVTQALRSNIYKLISSEIVSPLSPLLRKFLIKLSLIDCYDPALLLKIAKDDSVIKEMEGIGSFICFDSGLNTYRIHKLLLDYLRERQNELSEDEKKEVWTEAALWFSANNRETDAVINFEKTGDYKGIVSVLSTLPMILPSSTAGFALELFDRVPEAEYRDHPMMRMIRARALVSLGRYEQCRAELLGSLPFFKSLPMGAEKHLLLASCFMGLGFLGFILSTHTRQHDYIHFFEDAVIESKQSGYTAQPPLNGAIVGFHVCRVIDPMPGEIEKFIAAISEMVPYTKEAMGGFMSGMYELAMGELSLYRGSLDETEQYLFTALEKSREGKQFEIENRALFYLLRVYLGRGDSKGIEKTLKELDEGLKEELYPNRYFHYDIVTGWYYIQTGRKEKMAPWLTNDYAESGLNDGNRGLEKLVKARYFLAEKRYPAALALLDNHSAWEIFLMGSIEMKALEAVCRYRLPDKEGAYIALAEARRLAEGASLFMPFAELGKDMRALTEAAIADKAPGLSLEWLDETRRSAMAYAKKLYRQSGADNAEPGKAKASPLSRRETEVLIGFSQGLTRTEIAGAASISPNTVKSAVRSIYNKLGALNQADAVRIAVARGIL